MVACDDVHPHQVQHAKVVDAAADALAAVAVAGIGVIAGNGVVLEGQLRAGVVLEAAAVGVAAARGGCLTSIALGFLGALVGTWIARAMKPPEYIEVCIGGEPLPIIWSIIGSALFVALIALISRPT